MIKVTYQGKLPNKKILSDEVEILDKIPFDEAPKDLHECCNCEGCLCEELCKKYEDEYFGKEGDINE